MPIKAQHITELRTCINDIRAQHSLPALSWTDNLVQQQTFVRAVHFEELRMALADLAEFLDGPAPIFSTSFAAGVSLVRATDINELRTAVRALAGTCSFTVSPLSRSVGTDGAIVGIGFSGWGGCSWTAASQSSFIQIAGANSGVGSGSVFLLVSENTSGERSGTVTVAGQTVTISQAAAGTVDPCEYRSAVTQTSDHTADFHVYANAGCPWIVSDDSGNYTLSNPSGSGNGTVQLSLPPNWELTHPLTPSGAPVEIWVRGDGRVVIGRSISLPCKIVTELNAQTGQPESRYRCDTIGIELDVTPPWEAPEPNEGPGGPIGDPVERVLPPIKRKGIRPGTADDEHVLTFQIVDMDIPNGAFSPADKDCIIGALYDWGNRDHEHHSYVSFKPWTGTGPVNVTIRKSDALPQNIPAKTSLGINVNDGFIDGGLIEITNRGGQVNSCTGYKHLIFHETGHLHGLDDANGVDGSSVMNQFSVPNDNAGNIPNGVTDWDAEQAHAAQSFGN